MNEALKIDKKLIETLLSENDIKKKFFIEIKGYWIFEINKFIEYIQDKNFLGNSYTKFKNRIGLNIENKFLNERNEVSLVWPFKDCFFEGGMTKEDQKRNEIFFNEILAQDEIDRLLDPKVLTNFKRITTKGEEKVIDFKRDKNGTIRENLIIKGNNLLTLYCLKEEFQGAIKLIYIDPPYNTGNDGFRYNDNFNHSTWLTFIKNRLDVAKQLLTLDGVIFVHCDENEHAYLKVLMDEIFGRENFIGVLPRTTRKGGKTDSFIVSEMDMMLVYCKNKLEIDESFGNIETTGENYKYKDRYFVERGLYQTKPLDVSSLTYSKNMDYVYSDENGTNYYAGGKEEYNKRQKSIPMTKDWTWRWNKEKLDFALKTGFAFLKDGKIQTKIYEKKIISNKKPYTIIDKQLSQKIGNLYFIDNKYSNFTSKKDIDKLFNKKAFEYSKPEILLQKIIELTTDKEDIILDYHLGSGTTAAVSHKLGRQYIGVEQMDYIHTVVVERLRKVIKGENSDTSFSKEWAGGGDFIYCELMKFNEEAIDKIQSTKTTENLLEIWQEMIMHYFLNYDVVIKSFNDNQEEFKKLPLEKQKKLLCEMLNKNQLYVSLSEIDDAQFKVSKEDKDLTKKFYK